MNGNWGSEITMEDVIKVRAQFPDNPKEGVKELERISRERLKEARRRELEETRELTTDDLEALRETHGDDQVALLKALNEKYKRHAMMRRVYEKPRAPRTFQMVEKLEGYLPYENDVPGIATPEYEIPHMKFKFIVLSDGTIERLVEKDQEGANMAMDRIIEEGGPHAERLRAKKELRVRYEQEIERRYGQQKQEE